MSALPLKADVASLETARHFGVAFATELLAERRLCPPASDTILQALRAKSYAGPIGLEVFNDDLKAQNPNRAARAAMTAFQSVVAKSMARGFTP
jgi:hypothetical protein